MHSKIFQITRTRVDKDNYLNEDTLMQARQREKDGKASKRPRISRNTQPDMPVPVGELKGHL